MLIKEGTLVFVKRTNIPAAERYGVVISSCDGKVLVQRLLSEESEPIGLPQNEVEPIYTPKCLG